jgi:hypothetical protein
MKTGWKEVARLGTEGTGYPHILVDAHGWCLRLGPSCRGDDKYFSSLPSLIQGLSEHIVRRRLWTNPEVRGLEALGEEVRRALIRASDLAKGLAKAAGRESQPMPAKRRSRVRTSLAPVDDGNQSK